jgi:hypothetical protein
MTRCIVVAELRADWPALAEVLGYRTWAHHRHPCFLCSCSKDTMMDLDKRLEWHDFTHDDYVRTRDDMTRHVTVSNAALHRQLIANLEYSSEYRGRSLQCDFPALGLVRGDRLLPTTELQDVAEFDFRSVPFDVQFLKFDKQSRLTQITPLYKIPNVSCDIICIDLLHSWHLGGCSEYVGEVLQFVLGCGVYTRHLRNAPAADAHQVALIKLKADVWSYYSRRMQSDPSFKTSGSRVRPGLLASADITQSFHPQATEPARLARTWCALWTGWF